jgi:hypothetical protein
MSTASKVAPTEKWTVNPQYGKENVYWLWDENQNYHDDNSPEAMDARAQLMEAAPDMLAALEKIMTISAYLTTGNGTLAVIGTEAAIAIRKAKGEL